MVSKRWQELNNVRSYLGYSLEIKKLEGLTEGLHTRGGYLIEITSRFWGDSVYDYRLCSILQHELVHAIQWISNYKIGVCNYRPIEIELPSGADQTKHFNNIIIEMLNGLNIPVNNEALLHAEADWYYALKERPNTEIPAYYFQNDWEGFLQLVDKV